AERFGPELQLWLRTHAHLSLDGNGVLMRTEDGRRAKVNVLLAALGRRPNLDGLELQKAGAELDERGVPLFDPHTLQIGRLPIFIAGDSNADRTLMHEAADEGEIAGFNAALLAGTPDALPQAF